MFSGRDMTDDGRGSSTRRRFLGATATVGASALLGGRLAGASDDVDDRAASIDTTEGSDDAPTEDDPGTEDARTGGTLVTDWRQPTPAEGSLARPVVADVETDAFAGRMVLDAPVDGPVRGYALADGAERWETKIEGLVGAAPAVTDGVVYVASDRRLVALDAGTGRERWSTDGGGSLGVAVDEDHVYVPTGSAKERGRGKPSPDAVETTIVAYDRRDGSVAWLWPFESGRGSETPEFETQPRRHAETLVVGGTRGLVGLDAASGSERWRAFDHVDSLTVADGVAYCALGDADALVAFDLAARRERWRVDVAGSDPLYHDGRVFLAEQAAEGVLAVPPDGVTAVDATTGEIQWQRTTWAESSVHEDVALVPTTPATIANEQVVFGAARTSGPRAEHAAVFGLDPESGDVETHWWADVPESMTADEPSLSRWIRGRPTSVDDHLLVSSDDPIGSAPRTQGVYALSWRDDPPGEGPATPNPVQTGGCRVEEGQTAVGVQPYSNRDDDYGHGYAYVWDVGDDGVVDDAGARNGTIPVPADAQAPVPARVTVRDRYGRTATETLDVDVEASCAEFSLTVTPQPVQPGEAFTAVLDVRNVDATAFDYHWHVGDQFAPDRCASWTTSLPAEGTYALSVRVTGESGFDETIATDVSVVCEDDA